MAVLKKNYACSFSINFSINSFFLNPSSFGLAQNEPSNFAISITASVNNFSSICVFGVNNNSSALYDAKYDSLTPYQASGILANFYYYNQLQLLQLHYLNILFLQMESYLAIRYLQY